MTRNGSVPRAAVAFYDRDVFDARPHAFGPSDESAARAAAPIPYDDLPPGSDIRREYGPDGRTLTITVPAEREPPPAVRRAAAVETMIGGAMIAGAGLGLALLLFFLLFGAVRPERELWLAGGLAFGAFGFGVFLLVWKVRYEAWLDLLTQGRRQATILRATADHLSVVSDGPYGESSHDLPRDRVHRVQVLVRLPACERRSGSHDGALHPPILALHLTDGRVIRAMPARPQAELYAVGDTLAQTLGVPLPSRVSKVTQCWALLDGWVVNRTDG